MSAILALLVSGIGSVGPLALAGGPLGIAVAWLGSALANTTAKLIVVGLGLMLLISTTVGLTVHVQHLERDRAAYKILAAEHASLQSRYGCPARPAHERGLAVCLTARERDVAEAQANEIARQRAEAAAEQARRDRDEAEARAQQTAADSAIDQAAVQGDGRVPDVLLQSWRRARAERGVK